MKHLFKREKQVWTSKTHNPFCAMRSWFICHRWGTMEHFLNHSYIHLAKGE